MIIALYTLLCLYLGGALVMFTVLRQFDDRTCANLFAAAIWPYLLFVAKRSDRD